MIEILLPYYSWIKAFHVISVIAWMAGIFYLPRLFVYHSERAVIGSELDETFQVMEKKLLRFIMAPAMISTWFFGLLLVLLGGFDFGAAWAWIKLVSVILMSGIHGWLSVRQKEFERCENTRSGRVFRIVNEIPTVLMMIIVIAVIVRPF